MTGTIRVGVTGDAPLLQDIEVVAGARFADVGFPEVAAHEPFSIEELQNSMDAGRCWVAVEPDDRPVGYVVVEVLDGHAHVEQLSVHPHRQGVGWGVRLMEHVERWARSEGYDAVTLTTFVNVAWNAPWYLAQGYEVMSEPMLGPELRARRAEEAAHGLDPVDRCCMVKQWDA